MVPEIVPGMAELGTPEKLIVPVTFDPFCVSCQFIVPIPAWPIMPAPSEAVVESVDVPDQVPVAARAEPAAVGELPPHAVMSTPNSTTVVSVFTTCHLQSLQAQLLHLQDAGESDSVTRRHDSSEYGPTAIAARAAAVGR